MKSESARGLRLKKGVLQGNLYFDRGSTRPRSDAALWVDMLVFALDAHPALIVHLCGHANFRESARSAELLGLVRARRVAQILRAFGVAENRITISSAGAGRPVVDQTGKRTQPLCRRVEVVVRSERHPVTA